MRTLPFVALLITALGVCASTAPRQTQDGPPVLSIRTDLVTLTVTVVDRKGAFVTGLRQDHFTIYDNDESRPIQFFTNEDAPATIGLVIDSSGSMRGSARTDRFCRHRLCRDESSARRVLHVELQRQGLAGPATF